MNKLPYKFMGLPASATISLGYLLLELVWIFVFENILWPLAPDPEYRIAFLMSEGLLFVFLNALLLYIVLKHVSRHINRTHEKLQESEKLYRSLFELPTDGIMLLNEELVIVDCNAGACRIFDADSKEEVLGKTPLDFSPERQPDGRLSTEVAEDFASQFRAGKPIRFRWQHVQRAGGVIEADVSLNRLEVGGKSFMQAIVRDVSEEVRLSRQAQHESEHRALLLKLYEQAQTLTDKELHEFVLNHAVTLTASGIGFLHLVSEDQKTIHLTAWNGAASTISESHCPMDEAGKWVDCIRLKRTVICNDCPGSPNQTGLPEGHVPLRRFMSVPVVEDDKVRIIFGVGNKVDEYDELDSIQIQLVANELQKIVNQRRLVNALKRSENSLSEAQRIAHIGSWSLDIVNNQLEWSDEVYRIFGLDPEALVPSFEGFLNVIHPDDREMVQAAYVDSLNTKAPYEIEHRLLLKDGSVKYVLERCETHYADDGSPLCSIGTVQDITERKLAQDAVTREQERLKFIFDSLPIGICLNRVHGDGRKVRLINDAHLRIAGIEREEDVPSTWARISHPDDQAQKLVLSDQVDRGEIDRFSMDKRYVHPSGRVVCVMFSMLRRQLDDGGYEDLTTVVDISERKRAVEELQEAQRQLQYIINNTHDAISQIDLEGNFIYVNAAAEELTGYALEQLLNMKMIQLVAPEHREDVAERLRQRIAGNIDDNCYSFEIIHKNGHRIWVELSASSVLNKEGELVAAQGVVRDITERKHMEEALEKRIVSLTHPMGQVEDLVFEDLFDLEDIQRLQDRFSSATNVSSSIIRPDGTPITKPSNMTRLCKEIVRGSEKGCANCRKSDVVLGRYNPSGAVIQPCLSGGLWDAGASIVVGGKHIASWLIGQVRDETQTEENMRAYAREIEVDEQEFMEAFYEVPRMSFERFYQIAETLYALANQISTSAFMNLQQARFIAEEKERAKELHLLSTAINQANEVVVITNAKGNIKYVNPAFETTTGYLREEVVGENPRILKSGVHDEAFYRKMWDQISRGKTWEGQVHNKRKNGSIFIEDSTISPISDAQGRIVSYVAVKRDITDVLKLEEQFRQAQKMEAVGRLASGVAHDFNNILQTILGYCGVLLAEVEGQEALCQDLQEIQNSAKRAGHLTRQLLAFSRKQPVMQVQVDLNLVVEEEISMLRRLLGESYSLVFKPENSLEMISADPSQMGQVVMNLVVNARDAMPEGGAVVISTSMVSVAPEDAEGKFRSGDFVCLSVADTGMGMEQEVLDHLFEPFFTTKTAGKRGTGLGLAVTYGIVEQHQGWIDIESAPREGSRFSIYLPVCNNTEISEDLSKEENLRAAGGDRRGTCILLVEDDPQVRQLACLVLREAGYDVIDAGNVAQATNGFEQRERAVDLLLIDAMLPDGMGVELADTLLQEKSGMGVILFSGYSGEPIREDEIEERGYSFMRKPFSSEMLLTMVQTELHRMETDFPRQK